MDTPTVGQAPEHLSTPGLMDIDAEASGYAPRQHLSTPRRMDIGTGLMDTPSRPDTGAPLDAGANGYAPLGQATELSTPGLIKRTPG